MANIQKLIERMRYWCLDVSLGYDQTNRWDIRPGGEADCSSLVIHCLREAGFDTGNASYTGDMSAALTARGWVRLPNNGNPQAGDILLNDADHVAVYLGGGQLAQASYDENHRASGGASGDQTGHETNVSPYYNFPWNCFLRYTGSQDNNDTNTDNQGDDFLMALSQYDQELIRNAVVEINNRTDRLEKAVNAMALRLGPVPGYSFDYLPAISNNINGLDAQVKAITKKLG
ncbi:MAG: NlpC/P60 family protein [Bifidobacterium psychraerophilum]|jgi:hypothetical protein|uniref:NlpC/P60 family protein n=1 Tax=Bifidobacterium psychraerophilum TaxID=218140 RepID=UPI0039E90521